ncbi:hypothetical protein D187_009493 [Cystobacter fuscus DSM 2262]|uniref:Uncharacterized protein n=1 Tax=Cystobacter fuscus (strain ATCC 25194 / DSM 2262 / NBRC 100088 / M29) TaxID=1242864 RepID=S9Q1V4_CYSF2|nr:hypothetical protein D187_009493 [Cystobacter fuscus DSM 2262]
MSRGGVSHDGFSSPRAGGVGGRCSGRWGPMRVLSSDLARWRVCRLPSFSYSTLRPRWFRLRPWVSRLPRRRREANP